MTVLSWCCLVAAVAAMVLADLRYLRIAQREHYLLGAPTRFAVRWWHLSRFGPVLAAVGVLAGLASLAVPAIGLAAAAVVGFGPLGLLLRGRTGRLNWTRRLRLLVGLVAGLELLAIVLALALGGVRAAAPSAVVAALGAPLFVDAALGLSRPLEERSAATFVARASTRLSEVRPRVVAITGSYGKTSTKRYVAHLLSERYATLASPRSFNNRAGLSRTVNELLTPGTGVLVAEMGTYGPGEIAEMCAWMTPEVAVITAIGPVHLERFGSLEVTLTAKAEITEHAHSVVLNVDDVRLDQLANELARAPKVIWRCSATDTDVDVTVLPGTSGLELYVRGHSHGLLELDPAVLVAPTNLACAIAVALALELTPAEVRARVATLAPVESRLVVSRADSGVLVLDDTFNANPAGAARALAELSALGGDESRRVLATPGMIELGPVQAEENARLARSAAAVATDLIVVGRTNRRALLSGAAASAEKMATHVVADREAAVAWVRAQLRDGDVVLYENDLPDHYP